MMWPLVGAALLAAGWLLSDVIVIAVGALFILNAILLAHKES